MNFRWFTALPGLPRNHMGIRVEGRAPEADKNILVPQKDYRDKSTGLGARILGLSPCSATYALSTLKQLISFTVPQFRYWPSEDRTAFSLIGFCEDEMAACT